MISIFQQGSLMATVRSWVGEPLKLLQALIHPIATGYTTVKFLYIFHQLYIYRAAQLTVKYVKNADTSDKYDKIFINSLRPSDTYMRE